MNYGIIKNEKLNAVAVEEKLKMTMNNARL